MGGESGESGVDEGVLNTSAMGDPMGVMPVPVLVAVDARLPLVLVPWEGEGELV